MKDHKIINQDLNNLSNRSRAIGPSQRQDVSVFMTFLGFVILAVLTSSCASPWPPATSSAPTFPRPFVSARTATTYEDTAWAKLFTPAFAKEYEGKGVRVSGMWIGVAQGMMCTSAGFPPWSDMVCVGIAPLGAVKAFMGQYEGQQWNVFIAKELSGTAFAMKEGDNVTISARASLFKAYSGVTGNQSPPVLTLIIDKLEHMQ